MAHKASFKCKEKEGKKSLRLSARTKELIFHKEKIVIAVAVTLISQNL